MLSEFAAMGGYGFYVWGAYGVTALALALEILALRARRRRAIAAAAMGEGAGEVDGAELRAGASMTGVMR